MTDITDEQRAAYAHLNQRLAPSGHHVADADWVAVRKLLPSELTNPQPVLPTEPGWYIGRGDSTWRCTDGVIRCLISPERKAQDFAPFTRLVPERPQITGDLLRSLYNDAPADQSAFDYMAAELTNGTDCD